MPGLRANRVRIDAASNEVIPVSGRESLRAHRSRQICSGQDAKRATRLRSGVPCQYAERCSRDPNRICLGSAVGQKSIRSRCRTNPRQIKSGTDFGPIVVRYQYQPSTKHGPNLVLVGVRAGTTERSGSTNVRGRSRPDPVQILIYPDPGSALPYMEFIDS